MKPISAADAVSPAFTRMRDVLARPFRLGTFLKIALVAMLAEIGCISASVQLPIQGVMLLSSAFQRGKIPVGIHGLMLLAPLVAMAVISGIWLILGYIFSRLRFVVFDLVVQRKTSAAASWRSHGPASWRYFGLNLLVLLALMILLLATVAPFLIGILRAVQSKDPTKIMPHMAAIFVGAIAVSFLVQIVDSVLRDFFLPQMALRDASIEEASAGCVRLLQEHTGEVLLYLLLKLAITMAFGMALAVVVMLCAGLIGLSLAGIGFLLFHVLWAAGTVGRAAMIAYGILAGLGLVALYLAGLIAASGINGVFRTAYAAYFFGSRYTPLGDKLDPPAVIDSPATVTDLPLSSPLPLPPPVW
jgi:hypothetical protein